MWRWPNFSGLTISEFINHGTVTFFPLLTSLSKFSQFPRQVKHVHFSSILRQRETRKISSIIRVTQRIIWTRSSIFCYWIDMNIYTQSFPVCNSGQHTYVTGLLNFFLFPENSFSEELASQASNTLLHKFFPIKQPSLEWRCVNWKGEIMAESGR